ncbi:UDP-N-acetylglucosamine 1-carboxyvinyltransferase [Candidatus Berkelbacteria bacterium]|nr:UDP-N-acetylglucosamine 1-carboxyvinyltransferase [Candidatus Berkelbacteria bacterium]
MAKLRIQGGKKLSGTVSVSGSKNAALKLIAATILATKPCEITNVPEISDVEVMLGLIKGVGARVERFGDVVRIDPTHIAYADPDPKLVGKMRASLVLIGPYLARFGQIKIPFPGGDLIGKRPIQTHIDAFTQMGVNVKKEGKYYIFKCRKLRSGEIYLNEMSVTATENVLMAASAIPGVSTIHIAASEPEIVNLAEFLEVLGAKITGAGSPHLTVQGSNLGGGKVQVIPDRLEAGTLLMAGMVTGSSITLKGVNPVHLGNILPRLEQVGARFKIGKDSVSLATSPLLLATTIDTRPYPGFPTDLQSPMATLLTQAKGRSAIFETMYEGRFTYVEGLRSMGAKITVPDPHNLIINGPKRLSGRKIYTPADTRAGGAFILAGLAARGTTEIENLVPIDRAYARIDQKLKELGAAIERV